jgi:hypothetical protein
MQNFEFMPEDFQVMTVDIYRPISENWKQTYVSNLYEWYFFYQFLVAWNKWKRLKLEKHHKFHHEFVIFIQTVLWLRFVNKN